MSAPGATRWQRLGELFDRAVVLSAAERAAFIGALHGDDLALRGELEALLAADSASGVLDRDLGAVANAIDASEPAASPGQQIGPWRLGGVLGRGGMGAVYHATRADGAYSQQAALKLIHFGIDSAATRQRFLRERQFLASLQHPHIARLLDGGMTADGAPYLAMELVNGERIDSYADARRLSIDQRLRLMLQVISAVQQAHQHLIVHRDLKPSNILVDADGNAKLLDFGIATVIDATGAATLTRERPLTPEYAAPEQLGGEPVTTATDVYALGLILALLLGGQKPEANATARAATSLPTAVDAAVAAARNTTPRQLARQLRGDLGTIVKRALAADPARRYPSAQALATDIEQWLGGRPILARPDSWWYRSQMFVRRHRLAVTASALAVLALIAATAFSLRQAQLASDAARDAEARALSLRAVSDTFDHLMRGEHFLADANGPASAARLLRENLSALDYFLVDQPLTRASLLARSGRGLRLAGDPAAAIQALREANDVFAKAGAGATLSGRDATLELARAQIDNGDAPAAAAVLNSLEQSLNPAEVNVELQHHALALLRAQLALAAGQLDAADAQIAAALALAPAPSGEHGARYGTTALLAGAIACARGNTPAAADRFVEALQAMSADPHVELAPPHQPLAPALETLARLGDAESARDYAVRWAQLRQRYFGAESRPALEAAALQQRLATVPSTADPARAARLRDALAAYWAATFVNYDVTREQKPLTLDRDL